MQKLNKLLLGAGTALVLSACGQPQNTTATAPPPVDQAAEAAKAQLAKADANKQLVESWYRPGITTDERMQLMTSDYTQHNVQYTLFAQINQVRGRDGFKLYLDTLSKLRGGGNAFGPAAGAHGPQPPAGNALYKVIADGDLVTVIHERYALQPGTKDKFYPVYAYVTYRVDNGKLAEDWDDGTLPSVLPNYLRVPVSKLKFRKQHSAAD
jgi:predicted SnoaL-like aldol condensation-catalyzing enzyme